MKKILIVILILALLTQFAAAKYVTTIFNFPEGTSHDVEEVVSLEEDANAFHAFTKLAEEQGLEMDMTYYEAFDSWFVNSINGIENSTEQYWHFWANNETSLVGIGGYVPEEGDVIELGFDDEPRGQENTPAEKAAEWLVLNQGESGEIGSHKIWGNAFALIALNTFTGNEETKEEAEEYLLSNQGEDGGFSYPGFDSDALHTSAALIGLIANNNEIEDISKGSSSPLDFLLSKQEGDGGFSGWGSSDVDTTSWSIVALEAANREMPSRNDNSPLDYLFSAQNTDGGFGYQAGQDSSEEYTAEALIAFSAAGQAENRDLEDAINWLSSNQDQDGCFSNAYTTALGAMALNAFEESSASALQCLEAMQLPDKGFGRDGETSNTVDTALAVIALSGEGLPTRRLEAETNPELVAVGSIAKFTVQIRNFGEVSAKNVSISLQGIPGNWIQKQTSETSFPEIGPGQTIEAEIYAKMGEAGNREVFASVSAEGLEGEENSNLLLFEIAEASLSVSLSMQG